MMYFSNNPEYINSQQKKDDEVTLTTDIIHLEPRSTPEEDNRKSVKTDCADIHVDNLQDDSGAETSSAKEDTSQRTFPVDSKSKLNANDS